MLTFTLQGISNDIETTLVDNKTMNKTQNPAEKVDRTFGMYQPEILSKTQRFGYPKKAISGHKPPRV